MERVHEIRNKKNSMVNHQSMPNRIFPKKNELYQKNCHTEQDSNNDKSKKLNTDSLDEAMKELLDICQEYNDRKFTMKATNNNSEEMKSSTNNSGLVVTSATKMTNNCDKSNNIKQTDYTKRKEEEEKTKSLNPRQNQILSSSYQSNSIEGLQQRQSNLQTQLDEVLQVAKSLASKQKRRLKCILEGDSIKNNQKGQGEEEEEEEEEDELIEFQQIENELRVSELNRQLDNIQEELRVRLYKRLLSNTNNGIKSTQKDAQPPSHASIRANSHPYESSPSSSSCCSDEPTTSSNSAAYSVPITITGGVPGAQYRNTSKQHSTGTNDNNIDSRVNQSTWQPEQQPQLNRSHMDQQGTIKADEEFIANFNSDRTDSSNNRVNNELETPTNVQSDLDSAVGNMLEFGALTPTTSKESVGSSKRSQSAESCTNVFTSINLNSNIVNNNTNNISSMTSTTYPHVSSNHQNYTASPTCLSTNRNNSANSDLERIEEDEEDCQDYYSDSDRFRTIYEEKLSPIIYGHQQYQQQHQRQQQQQSSLQRSLNNNPRFLADIATATATRSQVDVLNAQFHPPPKPQPISYEGFSGCMNSQQIIQIQQSGNYGNNIDTQSGLNNDSGLNNSASSSGGGGDSSNRMATAKVSRPLTLYLPRPDDEIDLLDHIQALGHDLSLISSDLRIDSTSAQGYLWKCCSNSSKKWLKRYFHLDRSSQILSYYETEAQLVNNKSKNLGKSSSLKNCIHFNEISDVYVDHKLTSGCIMDEKDRRSPRKKSFVFVLATCKRKYLLASSRAETMRAWIDTLFTAAKANDYFQEISSIEEFDYSESFCGAQQTTVEK